MEPRIEPSSRRIADFAIAGLIVALAVTLSPIGIRLITGRLDLSPRITVLSLIFSAFLLVLAAAVLSRKRTRIVTFYVLLLSFPVVLLAEIETAAIAFHLADWFAPLEDMSTLGNRSGWPAHLMSAGRKVEEAATLSALARARNHHQRTRLANCAAHTQAKRRMADRDHWRFSGIWLAHA